ncbi:MAG: molybdopterin molybdotransferase MoeA [Lentimicrobium sp.]|nr:molybdopterin molybdotransferase MoeA [Lentimicrobium sp.]
MITFEEALAMVRNSAVTPETEQVLLAHARGRVLAQDVFADIEMPPFNKAAVDGYACRRQDLPGPLEVVEIIAAGVVPESVIAAGHCSKIMTGGMVPQGADTIIMVEDTETLEDGSIMFAREKTSANIAWKAEDVTLGQQVLSKGTLLKPQHIAILAAMGVAEPLVYRRAVAGIISTGDELVEPGQKPGPSQIRNSNAHQLMAQAEMMGLRTVYLGIASDTPESIRQILTEGFKTCDIILLTGGVSMGDFDYVPAVLNEMEVQIQFKSIAVQPGRPTVFGIRGNKFLFGLPGNPVSSFVQFELLVKPLAYKAMGYEYHPQIVRLPLARDFSRKKGSRKSFIPVRITPEGKIQPLEYHGSAHIHSYEGADGIMAVELGETFIAEGELRDVRQL